MKNEKHTYPILEKDKKFQRLMREELYFAKWKWKLNKAKQENKLNEEKCKNE